VGYDSIVLRSEYEAEGVSAFAIPPAYDYRRQVWMDEADHAHVDAACILEPAWCGADLATCQNLPREA
jgi:hypothetical protein